MICILAQSVLISIHCTQYLSGHSSPPPPPPAAEVEALEYESPQHMSDITSVAPTITLLGDEHIDVPIYSTWDDPGKEILL